jgi:threonine dehydratase
MVSPPTAPTIADIRAAHARIAPLIVRTPTRRSNTLSELYGAELWLKFDNLQFTASFKERGALNKLLSLTHQERERGVVAASAGNHAQAVAYHARRLGMAATIVMPVTTPFIKVTNTEVLGATVVQHGYSVDDARQRARELAETENFVPIPPFDDTLVIAGQGTLGVEFIEDSTPLDVMLVPVGGGGLMAGVVTAVKALSPSTQVIGVQAERFCAFTRWIQAQRSGAAGDDTPLAHPSLGPYSVDTLADGIAVKTPGGITREITSKLVDDMLLVSESALERAVNDLLEFEKSVVEGAGAAALAAVIEHRERFAGKRVGCVVSGGNIDPRTMADIVMRGLVRAGRLARLRIDVRDLPGSLAELTRIIAEAGANIVDVVHERVFMTSPMQRTRLSIEVATRNHAHARRVAESLRAAGHEVEIS